MGIVFVARVNLKRTKKLCILWLVFSRGCFEKFYNGYYYLVGLMHVGK